MHLAPWAPGSNLAVRVNRAIDGRPGIQQEAICYQWFKQLLILSVSKLSFSQRSQIKEDTVEPSVPGCNNLTLMDFVAACFLPSETKYTSDISGTVWYSSISRTSVSSANTATDEIFDAAVFRTLDAITVSASPAACREWICVVLLRLS